MILKSRAKRLIYPKHEVAEVLWEVDGMGAALMWLER